jgi:predicted ABC-class ATPase
MHELEATLGRIDGRGFKAYKELEGRTFRFDSFALRVEHVQGDPYAAPSKLRARVALETCALPNAALAGSSRRRATRDFVARAFRSAARGSRELAIDAGRQTVLDRSACLIDDEAIELRFTADLPASGRRVRGRRAADVLVRELPAVIESAALAANLDLAALDRHCAVVEDQSALRAALAPAGLLAFVADGSVLPRRSGVDDRVLEGGVLFSSPPTLQLELQAPNAGAVRGMGISRGVTLIVGGGFHGKSTLLRALESGIWDHVPGDGRERVVADSCVVKIRAEDGRAVHGVDISDFIAHLPGGRATDSFTTDLASGSTSQAAALVEAVAAGATAMLLDEDTSATNFMIRDRRMQALVAKASEPITPFVDRVQELRDRLGVSTILVMGGSGDYFESADRVIHMDGYLPRDVTEAARRVAGEHSTGRSPEHEREIGAPDPRLLDPQSIDPCRRPGRWRVQARGTDALVLGRADVDLRALEQLADPSQLRAAGWLLGRLCESRHDAFEPMPAILEGLARLEAGDWDWLTGRPDGDLAAPRAHEVMAVLNRLRGARFVDRPRHGS